VDILIWIRRPKTIRLIFAIVVELTGKLIGRIMYIMKRCLYHQPVCCRCTATDANDTAHAAVWDCICL